MMENINTTMTQEDLATLREYNFIKLYDESIGKIYVEPQSKIFICEIGKPYMPIEEFKNLLMQKGLFIKEYGGCNKFIFDKRAIRTFHQPSMEWYYVIWKVKMLEKFGLRIHRKLFTKDIWFRKAIEVGRAQIKMKYPDSPCHSLDIRVYESIRDAILN